MKTGGMPGFEMVSLKIKRNLKLRRRKLEERKLKFPSFLLSVSEEYERTIKDLRESVKGKRYFKSKETFSRLYSHTDLHKPLLQEFITLGEHKLDSEKSSVKSPERLGLRSKKVVEEEKKSGKGIRFSPNFGVIKKFAEEIQDLDIENQPNIMTSAPKGAFIPFETVSEDTLDRRAFKSIENVLNPTKERNRRDKESVHKEMMNIRKQIEMCDILSGRFVDELME